MKTQTHQERMEDVAHTLVIETRCEERPEGSWGPNESTTAQDEAHRLAGLAVEAGEITADMRQDYEAALYRWAVARADQLGAEVL